jgi:hypothetical protein
MPISRSSSSTDSPNARKRDEKKKKKKAIDQNPPTKKKKKCQSFSKHCLLPHVSAKQECEFRRSEAYHMGDDKQLDIDS